MKGSNSIKSVLPAIIASSDFLQAKYTDACYRREVMPSFNFKAHAWLLKDESGNWISPYKRLPPVFGELSAEQLDTLYEESGEELQDRVAAMIKGSVPDFD